jgi:outer membrane lipoprotein SlyB
MRSALLALVLLLTGCAAGQYGGTDAAKEVVKLGVIESIAPIEMDASSGTGSMVGSIFGQAGGASTGSGRGAATGSILGTVIGGTLGNQAGIATQPGLEIWVRLNDEGKSTYVMQPGKPDAFKIGEHVRVVRKKGETRVEAITGTTTPNAPGKP